MDQQFPGDSASDTLELPLAPDFPGSLEWVNCKPLAWKDLKGQLVLILAWSYPSSFSLHAIDYCLSYLEHLEGKPVTVIGIHVGSTTASRERAQVKKMVEQLGIPFPVANDPSLKIPEQFGLNLLPAVLLVGPDRRILFPDVGEAWRFNLLDIMLAALEDPSAENYCWADGPVDFKLSQPLTKQTLQAPYSLASDPQSGRIFVSDIAKHQVMMFDARGKKLAVYGSGTPGFKDGSAEEASFYRPRGLLAEGKVLWVADSSNHALRKVDLETGQVSTAAGVGIQGYDYVGYAEAEYCLLNSPWDLERWNDRILISMAGSHQIWEYDPENGNTYAISGLGCELHLNAQHPMRTGWAMPTGLCRVGHNLYVADAQNHAIRCYDLNSQISETVAGGILGKPLEVGADGDLTGAAHGARFQHPESVLWWEERRSLIIADTYNNKLKLLETETNIVTSLQLDVGSNRLWNPTGLAWHPTDKSCVLVADCFNSCLKSVDLEKQTISKFQIT